jgi:hypothetical protein
MGKGKMQHTYRHPNRRKKADKPQPNVTINRVKRVIEVKAPDDIDLDKLAEMYRMEGMKIGVQLISMMPQQLIDAVVRGDIPKHVDTISLLKQIKEGIESAHRSAIDRLEKLQVDLENLVGYQPMNEEAITEPDVFVRLITIPEEEGGGFCAELDPQHRGVEKTKSGALKNLASLLAEEG